MLLFALFLFFILFAGIVGYTWYRLHKSMHLHVSGGKEIPTDYALPYDSLSFTSKDGIALSGWYIAATNPKAIIILVHGRALKNSGKSLMLPLAKDLYSNGYSTF